jgi:hypothetical protein
VEETATTRLQDAAYGAQWAAALPSSRLGQALLGGGDEVVPIQRCRAYIDAVRALSWFATAFTRQASTALTVVGGRGTSAADRDTGLIKIGTEDRQGLHRCEQACLHELAHIVTPDRGPDSELRETPVGEESSRGHHHAWRANFIFIVQMTLGKQAGSRLRYEFGQWGLPTR